MLRNLVEGLENSKRPLLGPNFRALKIWGLLLPKNIYKRTFYLGLHLLIVMFFITECIEIWFVKDDINLVLNNVKITLLAAVTVAKVISFLMWQKDWKSIIEYVTKADLALRESEDKMPFIKKYTKYCRKMTYLYWFLMSATAVSILGQPIVKYISSPSYRENLKNGTESYLQIISSWVPFDKNTISGYIAASIYHSYSVIYGSGQVMFLDSISIVMMAFIKSELEMLRLDSANIFGKGIQVDSTEALQRLLNCHQRYTALVENTRLLDSCLSPIMFLYIMSVCSVMLCATFYQLSIETNPMQRFLIAEYLIFGIAQLLMFCWHSNEVLYASQDLMLGPYESEWWSRSKSEQRNIIILMGQFSQTIVFTAGPFSNLNVYIFINILKGAYSYYTLLN